MKLPTVRSFPAMIALLLGFSCQEPHLLSEIPSSQSGIDFQNTLLEDEFMNIEQFYNVIYMADYRTGRRPRFLPKIQ